MNNKIINIGKYEYGKVVRLKNEDEILYGHIKGFNKDSLDYLRIVVKWSDGVISSEYPEDPTFEVL